MKQKEKRQKEKKNNSIEENRDIINNNKYDIKLWDYYQKNIKSLT